jgi:hypothetical protein
LKVGATVLGGLASFTQLPIYPITKSATLRSFT